MGLKKLLRIYFLVEYDNSKHIDEQTKKDIYKLNRIFQKSLYEKIEKDLLFRGININFVTEVVTSILQHTIRHIKNNNIVEEKKKMFIDKAFDMC